MMIWAFRSGVSVVTLLLIQRDLRKCVEWLGKKTCYNPEKLNNQILCVKE